jgi:EmrB/QacA subfamily drug resistance transporter
MDRKWQIFSVTALTAFMVFLDGTIVNIAFPAIHRSFPEIAQTELSWVLNAYSMVFAALLLASGRLADLMGRRRIYFGGLLLFTLGSVLCGLAPSVPLLIAARVLQAVGAALLVPASLALLLPAFPLSMRALAVGLYGAVAAVAAASGPSLGSILIDKVDWRWAFFINAPIALLAWLRGRRILEESRDPAATARPDILGVALLIVSMGALALAIVQGNDWGWGSARIVGALTVAALGIPLSIWRAATHASPVIDLTLFRVRSFSVANGATLLFAAAFFAMLLGNVLFLTSVWHYTILQAGFAITPGPLFAAAVAGPAGRFAGRFGHRVVLVPGACIFATGILLLLVRLGVHPAYLTQWLPASILTGIGVGLSMPTQSSASAASLHPARFAIGSAVNNTARQFGAVLGVAVLISILGTPAPSQELAAFQHAWEFCLALSLASGLVCLALGGTVALARSEPVAPTAA